jgi:hypothetical protein
MPRRTSALEQAFRRYQPIEARWSDESGRGGNELAIESTLGGVSHIRRLTYTASRLT